MACKMNNKLKQCMSIKNVWKAPGLLPCVEIKINFLLSNSNEGLLFEQSCVTQLVNDIMSFLCWVYVSSLFKEYMTTHSCPSTASHNVHWSADHPEQPRHPQCIHSTILPASSLDFGTRQIQLAPKFVSLVWMHLKQHRFSYPCFFHFAIKFLSAMFSFRQYSYNCLLMAFLL